MRKEIMKGEKTSTDILSVRRWMAIAAVPLFALICSFALRSEAHAYTITVGVDGTDTDGCEATASTSTSEAGVTITITATPANRFDRWSVNAENVELFSTTEAVTTFEMPSE